VLADFMGVRLSPTTKGLVDARAVPDESTDLGIRVDYNPNRPRGRLRFNLAHELAHTLFPDVAMQVRNRTPMGAVAAFTRSDDWQLEMLCNIAASEFLLPANTLDDLGVSEDLDINTLMNTRERLQVSTEALLRRVVALTSTPATMFTAHRRHDQLDSDFLVDYSEASRTSQLRPSSGLVVPRDSTMRHCTAVGFTSSEYEDWGGQLSPTRVDAVGIPAYPGKQLPRVAGLLLPGRSSDQQLATGVMREVVGDLFQLRGPEPHLILQIVNDRARKWGGPLGSRMARRYPIASHSYMSWTQTDPDNLQLGAVHVAQDPSGLAICSLVAQQGYGPSDEPRLRYPALSAALQGAAQIAELGKYSVHAPPIGAGQAGGRWEVIRDEIDRALCRRGIDVTIYRLPR
jgi:hypothetical protein